jgi:hypothetical protein
MNITNILYWFPLVWWLIHWDVLHRHSSQGHTSWGHYHWHNRLWQRSAGLHPTGLWTASLQWVWLSKLRVSESSCTHNCMKCVGYHISPCVCSTSPHCPTQQCVHCTMDWSLWLKEWHVKGYWESTKWSSVYSRSPAERCLESVQQDAMSKCSLNWTTMILGHAKWEKRQQALQLFFPNASGRCATRLC